MVENTLTVGKISEGFVLDHIEAGKSMEIYKYLHLDKLDCCVAIIKNAKRASDTYGERNDTSTSVNIVDRRDKPILRNPFTKPAIMQTKNTIPTASNNQFSIYLSYFVK